MFATAGATQGLNLLSHMLFSEGDLAFVEDPTYFLAMKMFNDAGMKVIGCEFVAYSYVQSQHLKENAVYS